MKKLLAIALTTILLSCAGPGGGEVQVHPLQHADAHHVAQALARDEKAAASSAVEIVADVRTNSIVVQGSKEDLIRLERRIRELDVR